MLCPSPPAVVVPQPARLPQALLPRGPTPSLPPVPGAGRLSRDVKLQLVDDLVKQGSALWFDRSQRSALVLWRPVAEWADVIYGWARGNGLEDSVVTVEEMQVGAWRNKCVGVPCCIRMCGVLWCAAVCGGAVGACPSGVTVEEAQASAALSIVLFSTRARAVRAARAGGWHRLSRAAPICAAGSASASSSPL